MNRRRFIRNIGIGTLGVTVGATPLELLANNNLTTISILHTNDIHSHIEPFEGSNPKYAGRGGLARIATLVNKQRATNPNTLLFDAGDMFQGTPYFNFYKGELMFKLMSKIGYDAGTIGNHEFDNGLQGILNPLPHLKFPLVISNYDFSKTILKDKFFDYQIFNKDNIKVGVYGLGIELEGLVEKKSYENTVYIDPILVAQKMEKFLKLQKKCDLVVCLSHLGIDYKGDKVSDMVLAKSTHYTDLIMGGHTHTYLEEPIVTKNALGNDIIVNQAWWGGLMMGKIDFVFERNGSKRKATYANKIIN